MNTDFDSYTLDELRARSSAKWRVYPNDVIPAWVAEMDFPLAEPIVDRLVAAIRRGDLGYPPSVEGSGIPKAVATWMLEQWGWEIDQKRLIVLPDVVHGVDLFTRLLSAPGDGVVLCTPIYHPFLGILADSERPMVEVPMRLGSQRWEIDVDGIDAAFRAGARLIILCSPHNPTGCVYNREELLAIGESALAHDAFIISDEIHAPLTYPGRTHIPTASLSKEIASRTVTITSVSKAWNVAGLKCAFAIPGSDELYQRAMSLPRRTRSGVSIMGIEATLAALAEGQPWLDACVSYLDGNRHLLTDLLAHHLPTLKYLRPEASYLAWLDCRELGLPTEPEEFFRERAKVAFNPGLQFGAVGAGFVRLNFATSRAILTEIVDRMARAVRDFLHQ